MGERQHSSLIQALWPALSLLAVLLWLSPSSYYGAGFDDRHYLEAARCMAAQGAPCLPANHWATRFPLVAPLAGALSIFGESRASLILVPLAATVGCIALLAAIAGRLCGPRAASLAALALVATPVFTRQGLSPNIDRIELLFLLASALALLRARRDARMAALGGALFALAVSSRPSALAWGALLAPLVLVGPGWARRTAYATAGGSSMFAAELALYTAWTGDPFHHLRLALGHTRIPSSELPSGFPLHESPLFNPRYIDGWAPALGIQLHWTVDPILNLVLHPFLGWTLGGVVALAWRARVPWTGVAIGAGLAATLFLTHVLAIDPKPRMFLPLAALGALGAGLSGARLLRTGRELPLVALLAAGGAVTLYLAAQDPAFARADAVAARWIAIHGPHAMHRNDRRALALVPAAHRPAPADAPMLGYRELPCADGKPTGGGWTVADEYVVPAPLHAFRAPGQTAVRLCRWVRA